MSLKIIVMFVLLMGGHLKASSCPAESEDIALTQTMWKFPQYGAVDVWISHNYDPAYWNPKFAEEQTKITQLGTWSKTLSNPCLRASWNKWLAYYQSNLDEARSELKTKKTKIEMDEFERSGRVEGEARKKYLETHPAPRPPL